MIFVYTEHTSIHRRSQEINAFGYHLVALVATEAKPDQNTMKPMLPKITLSPLVTTESAKVRPVLVVERLDEYASLKTGDQVRTAGKVGVGNVRGTAEQEGEKTEEGSTGSTRHSRNLAIAWLTLTPDTVQNEPALDHCLVPQAATGDQVVWVEADRDVHSLGHSCV